MIYQSRGQANTAISSMSSSHFIQGARGVPGTGMVQPAVTGHVIPTPSRTTRTIDVAATTAPKAKTAISARVICLTKHQSRDNQYHLGAAHG